MDNKLSLNEIDALALDSIHGGRRFVGGQQPTTLTSVATGSQGTSLTCPAGTSPVVERSHTTVKGTEFGGGLGSFTATRSRTHIGCESIKK